MSGSGPPSRRRILVFGLLWLAISIAALLIPGCYGRNCEGGLETFGTKAGEGRMVDDNTWESTPQEGKWLFFPRQRYYVFDVRALGGRTPALALPYLSAQEEPQKGGNFTLGGGNLALLQNAVPNRIDIRNDSCSDYYLRLVIVVPPRPPPVQADGGAEAPDAASSLLDASSSSSGDAEAGP